MNKFLQAIRGKEKISVIAEIKLASPSHGRFEKHAVPTLVKAYKEGHASAISVVTAKDRFNGSLALLQQVKSLTSLPILRKDFIKTPDEIKRTVESGASAMLLIANILTADELNSLARKAHQQGLIAVIELRDAEDLAKLNSLNFKPQEIIIGINNRDLKTLKTNVNHALKLIDQIDSKHIIIAESAFANPDELKPYHGKIDAVLIGTTFLVSKDPLQTLLSFTQGGAKRSLALAIKRA